MTLGRPSDYNEKRVAKVLSQYINDCKANYYLPTVEGLAVELDQGKRTLYGWAKDNPDFQHTLDVLLSLQGSMLIQNGLKGEYNSTITKLMLSANHDYREKTETDITSGGEKLTVQPIMYANPNTVEVPTTDISTTPTESTG